MVRIWLPLKARSRHENVKKDDTMARIAEHSRELVALLAIVVVAYVGVKLTNSAESAVNSYTRTKAQEFEKTTYDKGIDHELIISLCGTRSKNLATVHFKNIGEKVYTVKGYIINITKSFAYLASRSLDDKKDNFVMVPCENILYIESVSDDQPEDQHAK